MKLIVDRNEDKATFLVYIPSNEIGKVIEAPLESGEPTVELTNCRHLHAPPQDFRPASRLEIEEYHRASAYLRPLRLTSWPNARLCGSKSSPLAKGTRRKKF